MTLSTMTLTSPALLAGEESVDYNEKSEPKRPYLKSPDMDLVQRFIGGDEEAFKELYDKHHHRVYSICLRILHNPHQSEDLTQDVFIQLHKKISTYRGEAAFTTWLHRMTVNQVLMYFRKRIVKYERLTENGVIIEPPVVNLWEALKAPINDRIALKQAIDKLPDGYKKVLILHDVDGYEHEQIARMLGCSIGTSKSQLHKARLKMQKLLGKKTNPTLFQPKR